jgi:hypothetical protein
LVGNEQRLAVSSDPEGRSIGFNSALIGIKVLEVGSYYGNSADARMYSDNEHPVARNLSDIYLVDEYTGIDLDEPREERERSDNSDIEFLPIDVKDLDKHFPERKWDVIFGNAFFGWPTKPLGRKGEVKLLQTLGRHLRDGGVMWFKNNEKMLMKLEDIQGLGFEYVERSDLYKGLWAIRKTPERELETSAES